jgi:flagellar basal-body rod protein FlgB
MPISFDSALGSHEAALKIRARRSELLASNLANADTPNYKARDIDFKAALQQSLDSPLPLETSNPSHIQLAGLDQPGGPLLYRVPSQPSLDGNTVDEQVEQAAFAENALRYQASLRFLSGRFQGLLTAIKGE